MAFYPNSNKEPNPNYIPPASVKNNLGDLIITKIVEANLWYLTCYKCGYKNSKDNLVKVCPICGTNLKIGTLKEIEL